MPRRLTIAEVARVDQTSFQRRMETLGDVAASVWKAVARGRLGSTSVAYRDGITSNPTDDGVEVTLEGTLPNIVEQGMGPGGVGTYGPYDVKKFVLKPGTSQLRRTKDGRMYVNVPFGHSSRDIVQMAGKDALDAVKSMKPSKTRPFEDRTRPPDTNLVNPQDVEFGTQWGDRLTLRAGSMRPTPAVGQHEGSTFVQEPHAAHPLEGMARFSKDYAAATQSPENMTWRRMVEGGKPWMSQGVRPRRFAEEVVRRMPEILGRV